MGEVGVHNPNHICQSISTLLSGQDRNNSTTATTKMASFSTMAGCMNWKRLIGPGSHVRVMALLTTWQYCSLHISPQCAIVKI